MTEATEGLATKSPAASHLSLPERGVMPALLAPHRLFLVIWLVAASVIAIFTPLGAGFDEPAHLARVSQVAHGVILPQEVSFDEISPTASVVPPTDAYTLYGGTEDEALQEFARAGNMSFQTGDLASEPYAFPWWTDARFQLDVEFGESDVTWAFPNTSINIPVVYLPYVVGFLLGSLTGNMALIGIVTRLCGVVFFGFCVSLAIRRIPVGKWLLAAVALSPLSLLDHSFVTADMMTFSAIAVFLASVLRLLDPNEASDLDWALAGVSGCVVAVAKLTYLPFGLLLFLVPALRADARDRTTWTRIAIICAAALGLFFLWYLQIRDVNTGAMWSDEVDPQAQTAFVLSVPMRYLGIYVKQLLSVDCLTLGAHFSIAYPTWLTALGYVASLAADVGGALRWAAGLGRRRALVSLFLAVVWLIVGFLIVLALYLQFTPVGALEVDGVQNRYFLPLVTPLLIALGLVLCPARQTVALTSPGRDVFRHKPAACMLCVMALVLLAGLFVKMY